MTSNQIVAKFVAGDPKIESLLEYSSFGNPFCTAAYARARQALGEEVWILGLDTPGGLELALACLKRGRFSTTLELPSLPRIAEDPNFWRSAEDLCRRKKVTDLIAGSFGSLPFNLPTLRGETSRRRRVEFYLPLAANLEGILSSNHKRNIKKAEKTGITVRRTRTQSDWIAQHISLLNFSTQRRIERGEKLATERSTRFFEELLKAGACELFQAYLGDEVLSSVLVLLSPCVGYYQSAGTSGTGMNVGASHFLIHKISQLFQEDGLKEFNLGGAAEGSSLARFKLGFGSEERSVPAAICYVGPAWKRKLRSAVHLARNDRKQFLKTLIGSKSRILVFKLDTTAVEPTVTPLIANASIVPLTEAHLFSLKAPSDDPEFRNRQLERLQRFGQSYAYGIYVDDRLAHISWLLPGPIVRLDNPSLLNLSQDEAEITCCETLPEFRGKSLYGFAIKHLSYLAKERGVRFVYMKTHETNRASISGIEKAGLTRIGSICVVNLPFGINRTVVLRNF